MPKDILIFSDGTGQAGGIVPDQNLSNIYKFYRATRVGPENRIDPDRQCAFYDPGLGTDIDASGRFRTRVARRIRAFVSSATGAGIGLNITDCYEAILRSYEEGDRIFLFGFSRGAYTARCVAGVLGLCGVPSRGADGGALPRTGRALRAIAHEAVHTVYEHGSGRARSEFRDQRKLLAERFRAKYASGDKQSNAVPYFVGVFDTVAALGTSGVRRLLMNMGLVTVIVAVVAVLAMVLQWLFEWNFRYTFIAAAIVSVISTIVLIARARLKVIHDYPVAGQSAWHWSGWRFAFYDTYLNPRIRFARHALAIDETRADFNRVLWGQLRQEAAEPRSKGEPPPFIQLWFAGNHSDIGGSYREDESRLSDIALDWMVSETKRVPNGIEVDDSRLQLYPRAGGRQHCEVESLLDGYPAWLPQWLRIGWKSRLREIPNDAPTHASVAERFALPEVIQCSRRALYRPEALRGHHAFAEYYNAPDTGLRQQQQPIGDQAGGPGSPHDRAK